MAGFQKSFFEDFVPTRDSYAEHADHYEAIRPHLAKIATDALASPIGVSEDIHMILKDWGFNPADVSARVNVWQGMIDRSTPPSHGEWLANNLGNARLHKMADQGHTTIIIECRDEIVDAAIEMLRA
jgi:pimeloyl-ACP methyl ester carboxylesterase